MAWDRFVKLCERRIHTRRQYLRKYSANCTWRGWLPPKAIEELEQAGNTVLPLDDGRYLLNSTGGHVQATLLGTIQPVEEVA